MAEEKTNVMRTLEQKKVPYTAHCYVETGETNGVKVAALSVYSKLWSRSGRRGRTMSSSYRSRKNWTSRRQPKPSGRSRSP